LREKLRRGVVAGLVLLLVAFCALGFAAAAPGGAGGTGDQPIQPGNEPVLNEDTTILDQLGQIRIPDQTRRTFTELYARHQEELDRIMSENPVLLWDSLDVVLDALPALRQVPRDEGRLHIHKRVYDKVAHLMERIVSLSGPQLSQDLRQSRKYVEDRMTETGPDTLEIDLN